VSSSETPSAAIKDFKIEALYRSAKLTWKAAVPVSAPQTVQIMRADGKSAKFAEIAVVALSSDKQSYEYVDKKMGTAAEYQYKLIIKETGESLGPASVRPFFSPPAT
jgi:hypothetical protein